MSSVDEVGCSYDVHPIRAIEDDGVLYDVVVPKDLNPRRVGLVVLFAVPEELRNPHTGDDHLMPRIHCDARLLWPMMNVDPLSTHHDVRNPHTTSRYVLTVKQQAEQLNVFHVHPLAVVNAAHGIGGSEEGGGPSEGLTRLGVKEG